MKVRQKEPRPQETEQLALNTQSTGATVTTSSARITSVNSRARHTLDAVKLLS